MATALVTVQLNSLDLTDDGTSTSFVYEGTPPSLSVSDATALCAFAATFYTNVPSGLTNPLGKLMSPSLDWTHGANCSAYDITSHLNGSPHGPPVASSIVSVASAAPTATTHYIPEGVAIAVSYRGDYGSATEFQRDPVTHKIIGRPRARHRGRIYVGP